MYSIDWWLSRLENVQRKGDGQYFARCPCHEDAMESLHLRETINEEGEDVVLVHCFAGCEYREIVASLAGEEPREDFVMEVSAAPYAVPQISLSKPGEEPAEVWWEGYTGIPREQWKDWGVVFDGMNIYFSWSFTPSRKIRSPNVFNPRTSQWEKNFRWEGGPKKFPLWPDFPEKMPSTIFLSEGESDWGVYKILDYPVWSVMQGSTSKIDPEIFKSLYGRGVRKIILGFDDDNSGHKGAKILAQILQDCGIQTYTLPLVTIRDPLLFEKDIRDVWFRYLSEYGEQAKARLREKIDEAVDRLLEAPTSSGRVSLDQFLKTPLSENRWLVPNKWLDASYGVFAGPPKIGKSIITMDLALSIASGTPFLGEFEIPRSSQGPVFLVGMEDSDISLQSRIQNMMNARGMFPGVRQGWQGSLHTEEMEFPDFSSVPIFFDLTRSFYLSEAHIQGLITWSLQMSHQAGYLHPKLIVLDPLFRISGGIDLFNASEVNDRVITPLKKIRDATGASVMLVHHTKKENKEVGAFDSWYGSVALFASSESFMTIPSRKEDADGFREIIFGSKDSGMEVYEYRPVFDADHLSCEVKPAVLVPAG